MAKGDRDDMAQRLRSLLPAGWFADETSSPVLVGILAGTAGSLSFLWNILQFVLAQTRITTATGGFLDLIAWDYFGPRFLRRASEGDAVFMPRIVSEVLRPRQTIAALQRMLFELTGRQPLIFEPSSTASMGSYGTGTMAYGFGLGYGSLEYPYQIFITAYRPASTGVANVSGYGGYLGGYGVGSTEYIDLDLITGPLLDSEIFARIAQTVAAGITAWTDIES